ncbi:MAG: hypothetical protein K9W44_03590 [Candidatus Lokiarchaeota archaeon]|nr:hypothetical protein [Candidatus Harpocratesius repetitus]
MPESLNITKFKKKEIIKYYRDNVYWDSNGEILEWNPYNREKILHKMLEKFKNSSEFEIESILEEYHRKIAL